MKTATVTTARREVKDLEQVKPVWRLCRQKVIAGDEEVGVRETIDLAGQRPSRILIGSTLK